MNPYPATEDHRALTELASDVSGIVRRAQETGRPVVLTTEGREVAVLLSLETFEEMQAAVVQPELQKAVDAAEQGIAAGQWVEHAEVASKLKRWAAGGK